MKCTSTIAAGLAFSLMLVLAPEIAHHSFAAGYDQTKPITLKGTVKALKWVNPHAYLYIDVKDETGKLTLWAMELLSPNALARQGCKKSSLKVGEQVTIEGYLAKDGKPLEDGYMSRSINTESTASALCPGHDLWSRARLIKLWLDRCRGRACPCP